MKKHLLICLLGLSLGACTKKATPEPADTSTAPGFGHEFTLYPQQQTQLPYTVAPELTVALADLDFTYCPPNASCLVGTFVSPKLSITDARGQTQQLALPLLRARTANPNWIDTTTIRANGRRYLVYYHRWTLPSLSMGQIPEKKDISVTLRVTK